MKPILTALLSGTLFGAGLAVSQMTNPAKVIGFLDVAAVRAGSGASGWDPSLAFVMGAALLVSAIGYQLSRVRAVTPGPAVQAVQAAGIDERLLLGAAIFGVGWGLAGLCPGPAIASLVTGSGQVLLFVAAMLGGMGLFELVPARGERADETRAPSRHAA
jgi:uncharacterized membrane protein YedE/YeeE